MCALWGRAAAGTSPADPAAATAVPCRWASRLVPDPDSYGRLVSLGPDAPQPPPLSPPPSEADLMRAAAARSSVKALIPMRGLMVLPKPQRVSVGGSIEVLGAAMALLAGLDAAFLEHPMREWPALHSLRGRIVVGTGLRTLTHCTMGHAPRGGCLALWLLVYSAVMFAYVAMRFEVFATTAVAVWV